MDPEIIGRRQFKTKTTVHGTFLKGNMEFYILYKFLKLVLILLHYSWLSVILIGCLWIPKDMTWFKGINQSPKYYDRFRKSFTLKIFFYFILFITDFLCYIHIYFWCIEILYYRDFISDIRNTKGMIFFIISIFYFILIDLPPNSKVIFESRNLCKY